MKKSDLKYQIELLEAGLERLASSEAFLIARTLDKEQDRELAKRMDYASFVLAIVKTVKMKQRRANG